MKHLVLSITLISVIAILFSCNKDDSEEPDTSVTPEWETIAIPTELNLGDGFKSIGFNDDLYFFASESSTYNNDSIFLNRKFFKIGGQSNQIETLTAGCSSSQGYPSFWDFSFSSESFLFALKVKNNGLQYCRYNVADDTWVTLDPSPALVENSESGSTAHLNGSIYLVGGIDSEQNRTNKFWRAPISGSSPEWEELPDHPFSLNFATVVGFDNKIFVFSQEEGEIVNQVTVYDLITNEWEFINEIPSEMEQIIGATIIGQVAYFLTGEQLATGDVSNIYSYELITNTWLVVADGPPIVYSESGQIRSEVSSFTSTENALYVVGEVVDFDEVTQTYGPNMYLRIQKLAIP